MDSVDCKIINILQEDARTSNTSIAKDLGMVPSAILERIRKLEERGVVKKYKTIISPEVVDLNFVAYVMIESSTTNWSPKCEQQLLSISYVEEVHEIMGEYSYMLKLRAKDMNQLSDLLKNDIGNIPEIKSTTSIMVVKTLKEYASYPIKQTKKKKSQKKPSK